MRTQLHRATILIASLLFVAAQVSEAKGRRTLPLPPDGEEWQQWQDAIRRQFAHARVEFSGALYIAGGGEDGCPRSPVRVPGLWADVRSRHREVFGDIAVEVFQLAPGADGYSYLRKAIRHGEGGTMPNDCLFFGASSFIEFDRYWFAVHGHCYDGALYSYEVGEVLLMLQSRDPSKAPRTFALGHCGGGTPEFRPVNEFLRSLTKTTSFWGRTFPEARAEERRRLVENPKPEEPSRRHRRKNQ